MAFGDFTVARTSVKRVLNASGVLASVAANTPAFEFNADGSYRGMPVEPAATNSIRNNTGVGAVVGTPGTLPTNWTEGLRGLTRSVLAVGVVNGVEYIDLRFSGTATSTGGVEIRPEASFGQIPALSGQIWTASTYCQVLAQPTPANGYQQYISEHGAGGSELANSSLTILPTTPFSRISLTRTLNNASTISVFYRIISNVTSGQSYDFTIRIGLTQMEQSAVATSVIKTTGSTATRTADGVTLTGASSLIGQTEGTLFVEVEMVNFAQTNARGLLYLSDGTTNNRIGIQVGGATDEVQLISSTSGSTLASITTNNNPSGIQKYAGAYALDDFVFYNNGVSIGTDTSATVPATSRIDIGGIIGAGQFQGWIRAVALYPTRLANATLATLTTP